ncbi:hypothetical protein ACQEVG_35100 [Streptomyces sp. CA-135486]|uniref:hypothetical protein n=1 Tax=Streptomyces sp. CA-135486 TaxID=3240049 RepID=UPI003D91D668
MDQRIDPDIQLEGTVGTDPAYIPGLSLPRPAGTEEADPEQTREGKPDEAAPQDAEPHDSQAEGGAEDTAAVGEKAAATEAEEAGGPVFEVSDRRGSITVDRDGVRFRLDDQEAEFRWDEIGAVEVKSPRFGRRFAVTVHLSTRRWFDAEVEAPARSLLKDWTAELDAVLDTYFEET